MIETLQSGEQPEPASEQVVTRFEIYLPHIADGHAEAWLDTDAGRWRVSAVWTGAGREDLPYAAVHTADARQARIIGERLLLALADAHLAISTAQRRFEDVVQANRFHSTG